jgi:rRNA maturation endonuclease Nob1
MEPLWIPINDLTKLKINLKGVNKDLSIKELQKYIKVCRGNPDKKISRAADKFFNTHQRLCKI